MDVIVAQQFRDGNPSAQKDPLSVAKQAYLALPEHIRERWFRGNSGCYEQELLCWLRHRNCAELFNYDPLEKRPDEELDAVRYLGDSRAQPARSVIRRPDHEVFRSGDQHLGDWSAQKLLE